MNRGFGNPRAENNPNRHGPVKKLDAKTTRHILARLGVYVMKYWWLFIPAVVFTLLANQLSLMGPEFSGRAIDAIADENGVKQQ